MKIRDENIFVINEYNEKVIKFDVFTNEFNDRIDELNDAKVIIRELKVELRERDLLEHISRNTSENLNTLLFIIEDEVAIATSKKLSNSSVFIDDKNSTIDDWLSAMRNMLEENANWFSMYVQQKTYVQIRIKDDAMKHLISRFFKNSIK